MEKTNTPPLLQQAALRLLIFAAIFALAVSSPCAAQPAPPGDMLSQVLRGDYDEVRLSLESGVDANSSDKQGTPALILAVRTGHGRIAALLLERGANPDAADAEGCSAVITAVKANSLEMLRALIARGAAIDQPDAEGLTPLFHALLARREDLLRFLLRVGSAVDAADKDGRTPLIHAVEMGEPALARILLEHDADPNRGDAEGKTPLAYAFLSRNQELIKLLLDKGADPEKTDVRGVAARRHAGPAEQALLKEDEKPATPKNKVRQPLRKTRLRQVGEPVARWQYGRNISVGMITVSVRNAGEETAAGVKIQAELPGGKKVVLKGPAELQRNQRADYLYKKEETVNRAGKIAVDLTCENCW